jgi:hypothetical protein
MTAATPGFPHEATRFMSMWSNLQTRLDVSFQHNYMC